MTLQTREMWKIGLVGVFVTALVAAQVTASKVLMFGLPVELPLVGGALILPGAALAYALTFVASDCLSEIYGKEMAQAVVNVGFVMNFLLLALVYSTMAAPVFPDSPVSASAFASVLGPSLGIVVGSLGAYIISQNVDVVLFHRIRDRTGEKQLWARNVLSTSVSQLIDTVVFIGIAFVLFQGVPFGVAVSLAVGQYLFKLGLAVLDTPIVYAVVRIVNRESEVSKEASPRQNSA